jgi:hypothetical protein
MWSNAMTEEIRRRLDLLKREERELRDQTYFSSNSLDYRAQLEGRLMDVSTEIAQLEKAS